jgi:CRISPR-associated protein Cas1
VELHNWLYVQDQNASLSLDHDAVRVRIDGGGSQTLPLLALEGIVCFGPISVSPALIGRCAEDGRALVFLGRSGKFQARVEGPCRGNVLLRRAQHLAGSDPSRSGDIARAMVAGKIQGGRQVLLRGARERHGPAASRLLDAAQSLAELLPPVRDGTSVNEIRGYEGEAAAVYFAAFNDLVLDSDFRMGGRNRRPPRDPTNALLSFIYTLVRAEVVAALEATGLDPQVGFLHELRPGRPALALDLVEEWRAPVADRLALSLINRRQLRMTDFETEPGGSVSLTDRGRRTVLDAYRARKAEAVHHPLLGMRIPWALVAHAQARVLARHLRGELAAYLPFVPR